MTYIYTEYDYLAHHGVKGMKWGVRHDRKTTGRKKEGGLSSNKKEQEIALEETTSAKRHSISEEQKKVLKGAAIGAAIGLGIGVGAYLVYNSKYTPTYSDIVLSEKTAFQRISKPTEQELRDVFFASFEKRDNQRYEDLMPLHYKKQGYDTVLKKVFHHEGKVRIAGHDTCNKIFDELYGSDREWKTLGYESFNQNVVNRHSPTYDGVYDKFFDELKKRGYHGFLDINDQKYNDYNIKTPLILFNDNKFKVDERKTITSGGDWYKGLSSARKEAELRDIPAKKLEEIPIKTLVGLYSGMIISTVYVASNSDSKNKKDKKQNKKQR